MLDPAHIDHIAVGQEVEIDARGFTAYLERHRDRTWHITRGFAGERRLLAVLEQLAPVRWTVAPEGDPQALRSFTGAEAALLFAITR